MRKSSSRSVPSLTAHVHATGSAPPVLPLGNPDSKACSITMTKPINIRLLEYPGAQKSALWGMMDLFDYASERTDAVGPAIFRAEIQSAPQGHPDVVILPPALSLDPPVLPSGWGKEITAQYKSGTMLASVCSGAFLLAETGVLQGRRVTTHWRHTDAFRQAHPGIIVDTSRLLVDLGDIVTAGGVMAWTDLTLHLIERYGGRKLMLDVARMFVLDPPEREQSHYATFSPNTRHEDRQIINVQNLLQANPGADHTIASLAKAGHMSERSFMRRFKQATGFTPVAYLQRIRVDTARTRLELTRDSFESIAWDVGYSDAAAFRRVFRRIVGLAPLDYRRKFGVSARSSGV